MNDNKCEGTCPENHRGLRHKGGRLNSEHKLKHLEFLQFVITRMASNSFLLKGWSVTLVAALFALAAKDSDKKYIVVAYFPVSVFWILDAYFLSKEKQFR